MAVPLTAAVTNLLLGIALFGAALLLPLYFEIVRGRTPLETGLLLIPQELGAALAMPVAGSLTDRVGARPVVTTGVMMALLGTAAYTQITAGTSYWYLAGALLLLLPLRRTANGLDQGKRKPEAHTIS